MENDKGDKEKEKDTNKGKKRKENRAARRLVDFITKSPVRFKLISILIGLFVGAIVLAFAGFNPFQAYWIIFTGIFKKPSYISYTIIKSTPIILTGLSVAFAFRTGLFNIGAEGQFIIGTVAAVAAGYFLKLPPFIHIPVVILCSFCAAAFWGGIAGILKAKFGIHEVISTIMLNWTALYFHNYMVFVNGLNRPGQEATNKIHDSASIMIAGTWKRSEEGIAWLIQHPFFKDILRSPVNLGFIIAIICALIVGFILKHTTLGYKLRAVGHNKDGAEYGGINVKLSMVISMGIAGGLAGLAGGLHVMGVSKNISLLAAMEGYGFDGIAVSLIGGNNAIGCVFSSLLFGGLKYGGTKIQPIMHAPSEIINIVIGTIVFFIAIPGLIEMVLNLFQSKKEESL